MAEKSLDARIKDAERNKQKAKRSKDIADAVVAGLEKAGLKGTRTWGKALTAQKKATEAFNHWHSRVTYLRTFKPKGEN